MHVLLSTQKAATAPETPVNRRAAAVRRSTAASEVAR